MDGNKLIIHYLTIVICLKLTPIENITQISFSLCSECNFVNRNSPGEIEKMFGRMCRKFSTVEPFEWIISLLDINTRASRKMRRSLFLSHLHFFSLRFDTPAQGLFRLYHSQNPFKRNKQQKIAMNLFLLFKFLALCWCFVNIFFE